VRGFRPTYGNAEIAGLQKCGIAESEAVSSQNEGKGPEITHGRVGMADAAGAAMDNVAEDLKERTNDSQ
jgi:hypothetical protein